jgi:ParB family chromosome partitioning protein
MSKRLGRGLDALIPSLSVNDDDKVIEISLSQLRPNPYQPRKSFDEDSIKELAESIKQHGIIQPIIGRTVLKGYEIIAGERRFRASQYCGNTTIPAVVRSFSDQQVMEIALIENLQREDLNAIEIAVAYQSLIDKFKLTQEELSMKVGILPTSCVCYRCPQISRTMFHVEQFRWGMLVLWLGLRNRKRNVSWLI